MLKLTDCYISVKKKKKKPTNTLLCNVKVPDIWVHLFISSSFAWGVIDLGCHIIKLPPFWPIPVYSSSKLIDIAISLCCPYFSFQLVLNREVCSSVKIRHLEIPKLQQLTQEWKIKKRRLICYLLNKRENWGYLLGG